MNLAHQCEVVGWGANDVIVLDLGEMFMFKRGNRKISANSH